MGGGEEEVTCLSPAKARPPLLVAVDAHSAEALGGQASHLGGEEEQEEEQEEKGEQE